MSNQEGADNPFLPTTLAIPTPTSLATQQIVGLTFSQSQIDTIKNTIAKTLTNEELDLFLAVCRRSNLDPFAKQIYALKMGGRLTTFTSIDGLRLIAQRTGLYNGQETYWCGEDGEWKDAWLFTKPPVAAKTLVWKKGVERPFVGVARYAAYLNPNNPLWGKCGDVLCAKCSESLALRKAFPNECSGLYTQEELDNDPEFKDKTVRQQGTTSISSSKAKLSPAEQRTAQLRALYKLGVRVFGSDGFTTLLQNRYGLGGASELPTLTADSERQLITESASWTEAGFNPIEYLAALTPPDVPEAEFSIEEGLEVVL